jgi:uncharacterized integral membrane protein
MAMGERAFFQPLTARDKVTVLIYRAGIVLSTLIVCAGAVFYYRGTGVPGMFNWLLLALQVSVGMSVVFIHLYIGRIHRQLKALYVISLACLALLLALARGFDVATFIAAYPLAYALLLPLSGCLGFVAAKEAFCFRLFEGYIIAMFMPVMLLALATGIAPAQVASFALNVTALMLVFFTLRKVFQPLHYDIGDKSAYT